MKCYSIFFLLVICIVATANALIAGSAFEILRNYQSECMKETGTSANDVEYAKQYGKFCDDGHLDKFAVCLLKKFNIINSDGSVNQDSDSYAQNLVTDDPESLGKVQKCTRLQGDNQLHTARKVINCVFDSNVYLLDPRPRKID